MDLSTLVKPLNKFASTVQPSPQIEHLNTQSAKYQWIINQRVDDKSKELSTLTTMLGEVPELIKYSSGSLRRSPNGGENSSLNNIAHWILAQSKLNTVESALIKLADFVQSNSVEMAEVIALWGIHPSMEIELTHNIHLIPFDSLPSSQPKDILTGVKDTLHTGGTTIGAQPRPKAALIHNFIHGPIHILSNEEPNHQSKQELMQMFRKILVIATKSPVFEISHWFQCDASTPIIGGSLAWSGQMIVHSYHIPVEPKEFDATELKLLISKFFSLDETVRKRLIVPIERLNMAMRSGELDEKAFELGVSLDSLLTNEKNDYSTAQKISQRGTALIGGRKSEKKRNFSRLKNLYRLRNISAHGGEVERSINWHGGKTRTDVFLSEGSILCINLIMEIINRGEFPDWDGLILGF